ncbi:MAG: cytochrome c3 family protein [Saprospiraceae bacterium]
MVLKNFTSRIFNLVILSLLALSVTAQDVDVEAGKTLFRNNCASCHNKDMKSKMTGPALGGVQDRWADYPQEDLYSWIRNSQALINEGHPKANELWAEWKPTVMNSFPTLSDQDIANILGYVDGVYTGAIGGKKDAGGEVAQVAAEKPDNTWLYFGIFAVLAVLAIVLARIVANLDYLSKAKDGAAPASRKTLRDILTSKGVVGFVIFAIIVLGGYFTVNKAIHLGRQQDYQPTQPIKFSHVTHAGLNKIDCNYCHDGARRSKHSVIPAANTCMNCHKAIKKGSTYGTAEISKIYASIGYNPNTDTYIDGYENWPQDSIERVFRKWIADNQVADNGKVDELVLDKEWDGIVDALTGPNDPSIAGPIEWVKIHNLPDHVYFNHSQHVTVGKIECQQCHGKVEEMEVVQQYSPLSMGWCINCHRQTEVKFAENEYYDNYFEKYHQEIKDGARSGVTVEDIGGLGCQKCHY